MSRMKDILIEIESMYASGASLEEISQEVGVSVAMVEDIIEDWFVAFEQQSE